MTDFKIKLTFSQRWELRKLLARILVIKGSNFGISKVDLDIPLVRQMEGLGWIREYDFAFGQVFFAFTEKGFRELIGVHLMPKS